MEGAPGGEGSADGSGVALLGAAEAAEEGDRGWEVGFHGEFGWKGGLGGGKGAI